MGHTDEPSADGVAVRRDWRAGLVVRLLRSGEEAPWRERMAAEHYLGDVPSVGECLRYVATVDEQWVALLAWGPAALVCGPRERWLGWAPALRRRRLSLVANNTRFLILNGMRIPNLASAVLAANTRRLAADWRRVHRHPVWLAETAQSGDVDHPIRRCRLPDRRCRLQRRGRRPATAPPSRPGRPELTCPAPCRPPPRQAPRLGPAPLDGPLTLPAPTPPEF